MILEPNKTFTLKAWKPLISGRVLFRWSRGRFVIQLIQISERRKIIFQIVRNSRKWVIEICELINLIDWFSVSVIISNLRIFHCKCGVSGSLTGRATQQQNCVLIHSTPLQSVNIIVIFVFSIMSVCLMIFIISSSRIIRNTKSVLLKTNKQKT